MRNLVRDEWVILSLLLAWSLAGLAVICERLYALWNLVPKSEAFKNRVIDALVDRRGLRVTVCDPLGRERRGRRDQDEQRRAEQAQSRGILHELAP